MSTLTAPFPSREAVRSDPAVQAFLLLRIAFTVAPILFGLDKFAGVLTDDWTKYLATQFNDLIPGSAQDAMYMVGVVEIVAGLLVADRAAVRRPDRRRLARRDHRQPAARRRLRRHRAARLRPAARRADALPTRDDAPVTEDWVAELTGPRRAEAQRRLYALLLKAADFEVRRRAPGITDIEDLVTQSADDALLAILASSTPTAARAASRPGPTSSRSTRRRPRPAGARGATGSSRSTPTSRAAACTTTSRPPNCCAPSRTRIEQHLTPHQREVLRRARRQRRADRRPRRAPGHHPRRALQDPARRAHEAARLPRRPRPHHRRMNLLPPSPALASPRSAATSASTRSTSTSS